MSLADLAALAADHQREVAELAEHYANEPCGRCGGDKCEYLTPAENE